MGPQLWSHTVRDDPVTAGSRRRGPLETRVVAGLAWGDRHVRPRPRYAPDPDL